MIPDWRLFKRLYVEITNRLIRFLSFHRSGVRTSVIKSGSTKVDVITSCFWFASGTGLHRLNRVTIAIATPLSKRSRHAIIKQNLNRSVSPLSTQPSALVVTCRSIACLDPPNELLLFAGDVTPIWMRHICFGGFCEDTNSSISDGRSMRSSKSFFQNIFRCGRSFSEVFSMFQSS
jgi:hypothetical protein